MVYKFLLLSDEEDDFSRLIEIDSDASFFTLHEAILDSVGYTKKEMTTFFVCEEGWEKGQEITLIPMDFGSDQDNYVMEETHLSDFIDLDHKRLLYVFDMMTERAFFLELRETAQGSVNGARLLRSKGNPPKQLIDFEAFETKTNLDITSGENFYGDEEFEMDELDAEGFDFESEAFSADAEKY